MRVSRMQVKIGVIILLVIVGVVLIVGNTEKVSMNFFGLAVPLPRAVWIVIAMAAGFVIGMLVGSRVYEGKPKKRIQEKASE